ncbi:MAG: TIGR04282 family arsenosugar biosynthesis glycosyltransferase [Methylococcaceae bacterium]|nr:TIGR04282 family arsenosugar biosynthesis glycosyltransferase [Methylococcaceae bacterium]
MNRYPNAVIMVFCKAPVPGQVKTRLIPPLTNEEAASLHRELTEKTLQTVTENRLCDVQLWCSPSTEHPYFATLSQKYSVDLHLQQGADLGERMHQAFVQVLAKYKSAILIGCDCPSLKHSDVEQALIRLSQKTCCVISPAEDGGYVLIGLNSLQPTLFNEMPWGTNQILGMTRARSQSLSFDCIELDTQWDLDTADDLERYRSYKR